MSDLREEMERLARKAWPDSERVHVDVDSDRDPNPFVEVYGELGGYKCVELSCCNERAVPAMLAAIRVLAGEEDPELATLRAENELAKKRIASLRGTLDLIRRDGKYADSSCLARYAEDGLIEDDALASTKQEQEVRS